MVLPPMNFHTLYAVARPKIVSVHVTMSRLAAFPSTATVDINSRAQQWATARQVPGRVGRLQDAWEGISMPVPVTRRAQLTK